MVKHITVSHSWLTKDVYTCLSGYNVNVETYKPSSCNQRPRTSIVCNHSMNGWIELSV